MTQNVIECLEERGFIDTISSEDLRKHVNEPIKVYLGCDPTADSLHLGNLVGIVALKWFQKFGHTPVILLGGATGRIGDPSGKDTERPLLSIEQINHNVNEIAKNFLNVLDFEAPNAPVFVNNYDWFSKINFIDFLRDVGKQFRMGPMLAKESVRARLSSEEGMSFTEFSYQLMQGYDFQHLRESLGVTLEMGGSDQWGNITAGIELVRKLTGKQVFGLTFPLITRGDGKKFGKSEEGAIWLSPEKCSPYQFYQHLIRVADSDVIQLMRMLTFMEMEEVREYEAQMASSSYVANTAQKRLAQEITRMIHGEEGLQIAERVTEGAAPGSKTVLDPTVLKEIAKDMPNVQLNFSEVVDQKWVEVALKADLVSSKGEATRLIKNGGAYLNNEKVLEPVFVISKDALIGEQYILLGSGKKKKVLVTLV